jgi:copper chaperone CopZ
MSAPLVDASVLRWLSPMPVVDVPAGVEALVARMPGVVSVSVSPDGREVDLQVDSVASLSEWRDVFGLRSAGVSQRVECRADGRMYSLGGLTWWLMLPPLVEVPGVTVALSTVSAEDEVLPDTALVRAMCPEPVRVRRIREREAAAARRMGWVA